MPNGARAVGPTGRYLIAASLHTDNLAISEIGRATGKLTPKGLTAEAGTPICVRFV